MKKGFLALTLLGLVALVPTLARADSIISNGSVYTLSSDFVPGPGNVYTVTLTIDTSGFSQGTGYLNVISVQFTDSTSATLVSGPGGVADWTSVVSGPAMSNGCQYNPGNHWCTELSASGISDEPTPVPGSTYAWVFEVTMPDALGSASHVQAFYNECADIVGEGCNNLGGTSEDITIQNVPEPATLTLLGTGLLGLAGVVRKRLGKKS